jgi:hypothetical protein
MDICTQKVYPQCHLLFTLINMVGQFLNKSFSNLQTYCYFNYKWHCGSSTGPYKASFASYGFIVLCCKKNNDNFNIFCLISSLYLSKLERVTKLEDSLLISSA